MDPAIQQAATNLRQAIDAHTQQASAPAGAQAGTIDWRALWNTLKPVVLQILERLGTQP